MLEIILWALLAFFSAFGIVEFTKFAYTDWASSESYYHVVVCADKYNDDVEIAVRNAVFSADCSSLIVVTDNFESNREVYEKLLNMQFVVKISLHHVTMMR